MGGACHRQARVPGEVGCRPPRRATSIDEPARACAALGWSIRASTSRSGTSARCRSVEDTSCEQSSKSTSPGPDHQSHSVFFTCLAAGKALDVDADHGAADDRQAASLPPALVVEPGV